LFPEIIAASSRDKWCRRKRPARVGREGSDFEISQDSRAF